MEQFSNKIKAVHLKRKAILYIRQSTMRQVFENGESTLRQYALKDKLASLGWAQDNIQVIDCDLGQSGASVTGREGFRQMIADVGSGTVGSVACIECSRLSRSSNDWGRLMEICALTGTILIDADGIYDPNNFNDRLLLGLKGTMSEAELHFIKERMRGGAVSKAKRGELRCPLPVGYLYDEGGIIVKDPSMDVRNAVLLFFKAFPICGTANRMVAYYRENGYKIPCNPKKGFGCGELEWRHLTASKAVKLLHNPAYAGIYAYGQQQQVYTVDGKKRRKAGEEDWLSYIEDHHEGYISAEEYRENIRILEANGTGDKMGTPPREGNALLQGIAICGKCGSKMYVSYKHTGDTSIPYYYCYGGNPTGHYSEGPPCQVIHGKNIDGTVSGLALERLTPAAVQSAVRVQEELKSRNSASDNYFLLKAERARYEMELAKKRYMRVDPDNRLVAFELENLWNEKISALSIAEKELREHEKDKANTPDRNDIERLLSLPANINELWNHPKAEVKDKKRILRCLIENVTLDKGENTVRLGILFKGGTSAVAECPVPLKKYETWITPKEVLDIVRSESARCTVEEIVEMLNGLGYKSGKGKTITLSVVRGIQYSYNIPSFKQHLRSQGYLSSEEKARQLGISVNALNKRRAMGKFKDTCFKTTENGDYMFSP